jgi:hypothetical protein
MSTPIALKGGKPVRTAPWPKWPLFTDKDKADLAALLDDGPRRSGRDTPWRPATA